MSQSDQPDQLQNRLVPEFELGVGEGDTPSCYSSGYGGTAQWTTGQLSPGASSAEPGFVIIHNYFSPNAPQGDSNLWQNTALGFAGGQDEQKNIFTLGNASGPGIAISTQTGRIGVPLDGQPSAWLQAGVGSP